MTHQNSTPAPPTPPPLSLDQQYAAALRQADNALADAEAGRGTFHAYLDAVQEISRISAERVAAWPKW